MVYGTMGGDGQPETQAAVFLRAIWFRQPLQQAVSAPRWLLGRTWGQTSDTLKLESRIPDATVSDLELRGHDIELPSSPPCWHGGAPRPRCAGTIWARKG